MKIRILMLAREVATGTLTYTRNIIESLQQSGIEVVLAYSGLSPPSIPCKTISLDDGIPAVIGKQDMTQAYRFMILVRNMKPIMRSFRPHLIYAQGLDELAFTAIMASKIFGRPAMTFVHDLTLNELLLNREGGPCTKLLLAFSLIRQRFVVKRAEGLVVSSQFMRKSIANMFSANAFVAPLGVGIQDPSPATKEEFPFRILFVGNLVRKKMPGVAIRAISNLHDLNATLTLVGEGPLRSSLEELCTELGVNDRVCFAGRLSASDLRQTIAESHACVVPSIWEAFGLAAIECMAAGLPVIASSSGGLKEVVVQGYNGYLTPVGDDQSLAKYIRELYVDREKLAQMARNSRETALQYSWDRTAKTTKSIIMNVLARN